MTRDHHLPSASTRVGGRNPPKACLFCLALSSHWPPLALKVSPLVRSGATAVVAGLTLDTGRPALLLAVMEAVALRIAAIMKLLRNLLPEGAPIEVLCRHGHGIPRGPLGACGAGQFFWYRQGVSDRHPRYATGLCYWRGAVQLAAVAVDSRQQHRRPSFCVPRPLRGLELGCGVAGCSGERCARKFVGA